MKKCSTRTAGHTVCRNTAKLAFQYFFKASGFRILNPFSAALSNRELASITAFDWIGLVLISFVLPAVLSWIFCLILRKIGWIKENDLKLDL